MTKKQRLVALAIATAVMAVWALVAFWVGPLEVARAHRGEGLPFLNDALAGRAVIPLEEYLDSWRRLASRMGWLLFGILVVGYAAIELLVSTPGRRVRGRLAERVRRVQEGGPVWPFAATLLVAVWLGLITGIFESLSTVITHKLRPTVEVDFFSHGWADMWMAPLVNAVLLTAFVAVLHLPRLLRRNLVLDRVLLFTLGVVAIYGLRGRVLAGAHPAAGLLLAVGVSAQLVRVLVARPERWRRIIARSTMALLAIIGIWTAAAQGGRWSAEQRRLAALPDAAGDSPSILLIILDTVRARNLSLYGYGRSTSPAIDSLAAGGVVFTKAMTPTSWTLPSHASMFTGRWAHELSTDWDTRLDDTYPTLAEWLAARGYVTAGFIGNVGYVGTDFGLERGFVHYDARPNSLNYVIGSSWLGYRLLRFIMRSLLDSHQDLVRVAAAEVRREFVGWLGALRDPENPRPFFAFLNLYDAHAPYLPPEPWHQTFAAPGARYWPNRAGRGVPEPARRDLIDSYDSSIAYADHQVGLLMDELARSGALDNTIVIITSDHGEEFGENDVYQHGHSLYVPTLHVPLVFLWPGQVPAGVTLHEPVSVRSLPATITQLIAGQEDPAFPDASLAHRWSAVDAPERPAPAMLAELTTRAYLPKTVPAGRGDIESILLEGFHYIRVSDGGEELFDLTSDPWEQTNLADTDEGRRKMRRLGTILTAQTTGGPRSLGRAADDR